MEIINLAALRKRAGLSQSQMAEMLEISQSQVSRYEMDPEEASQKLVKRWISICGDLQMSSGVKLEVNKHSKIKIVLDDVCGWFHYAPSARYDDFPDLSKMLESLKTITRKPRIAVAGQFDSGKSTMLNFLLGGNSLPTAYQPTTSLVCLIRHISDKPNWQVEPAAILSKDFDFNAPDDKENFEKSKLFVGGYEILKDYAQHPERISSDKQPAVKIKNAAFAIAYINSPILEAGDFIDLPGYSNNEEDSSKAEIGSNIFDVLIYMSTVHGFLDGKDCSYLPTLIDKLNPVYIDGECKPLANLYLVCTQIHSVTSNNELNRFQVVENLLSDAANRVYPALSGALNSASKRFESKIDKNILRSRMFGFSVDASSAEISEKYINDIKIFLGQIAPESTYSNFINYLKAGMNSGLTELSGVINYLEQRISNREKAVLEVEEILAKKSESKENFNNERKRLIKIIDDSLEKTKNALDTIYSQRINTDSIEKLIRDNYSDKKDAEKYIPTMVLDGLKREVDEKVSEISSSFNKEVTEVLKKLSLSISPTNTSVPFDAQSAFLSTLTGLGAVGALAGWAALVAGGSNLGAYILIGKVVGWLAAMGVPIGSSAAIMSTVAAIGGPVTIAIGIGILIASAIWAIFGSSWQKRMAKKIVENFQKQNIKSQYLDGLKKYWKDTKDALQFAMDGAIKEYEKYINARQKDLDIDVNEINDRIDEAKRMEGFLRSSPNFPEKI